MFMFVIRAEGLNKEWNGQLLFENVSIEVAKGERVALIGRNGVGKTTLLQILIGAIPVDQGTIYRKYSVQEWGTLDQHLHLKNNLTLLDFVQSGIVEIFKIKKRLDQLQSSLETATREHEDVDFLVEQFNQSYEQYVNVGGYEWEDKVEMCLKQVNLSKETWFLSFNELSGGQKTRAQIARILIGDPKFLILDEPTNHLDNETLEWLENWLAQFPGTILFTSHDRDFIDKVATITYEITATGTKRYIGGYTHYREQRNLEERTHQALYEKQKRERNDLVEAINRYKQWFQQARSSAKNVDTTIQKQYFVSRTQTKNMTRFKAKEAALERLEKEMVKRPKEGPQLKIKLEGNGFEAKTLVKVEKLSFSYGPKKLFHNLNILVKRHDRMAVIGSNGVGKTTLLKLLTSQMSPNQGKVINHPQLRVGYFAQELEHLNGTETIIDSLLSIPDMTQDYARLILACFLFRKEDVFKTIAELSMGERCRVAFVKLYFSAANLLVLDEPTNYLDIDTRERMEDALNAYPGALIIVSHDRFILKKLANRVVSLQGVGEVTQFSGTYDEYMEHLKENHEQRIDLEQRNRIRQLELQLAQLIGQDTEETSHDKEELVRVIKETRDELDKLKMK
jgi:ATP-binding cassette subfamily F protein 3